jgi:hypothetical protein
MRIPQILLAASLLIAIGTSAATAGTGGQGTPVQLAQVSGSANSGNPGNACRNPHDGPIVPANNFVCMDDGYWHGCLCEGGSCRIIESSNMGCDPGDSLGAVHD